MQPTVHDQLAIVQAKRLELEHQQSMIATLRELIAATELGKSLALFEDKAKEVAAELAAAEEQARQAAYDARLLDPDFKQRGVTFKPEIEIEIDSDKLNAWCRANAVAALDNAILKPQITAARTWAKNQGINDLDKPDIAARAAALAPFATALRVVKVSIAKDLGFLAPDTQA